MSSPTVTPSVVYDDAFAGIDWLTRVLGMTLLSRYPAPDGSLAFAELGWRTGVVFVSSRPAADNPWSRVGVASIALVAPDAEAVRRQYLKAVAAGADVVRDMHVARTPAFPQGSAQFDLRDPEGNLWTIGTYQPKAGR
ncbi:MAG TPA: VOC family protein [Steroidobacteraceae bacterium]|nr:VOC family protein [Steroidobacteraceae bacterium]